MHFLSVSRFMELPIVGEYECKCTIFPPYSLIIHRRGGHTLQSTSVVARECFSRKHSVVQLVYRGTISSQKQKNRHLKQTNQRVVDV